MTKTLKCVAGLVLASGLAFVAPALAAGGHAKPLKEGNFSFEGPFGAYDIGELQRGYKVYRNVCATCHSMNLLSYRNLGQKGGPFYDEKYPNPNDNPIVKQIASEYEVTEIDANSGDEVTRKATPSDRFAKPPAMSPTPPDLSVMAKARKHGPDYIYSLLQGYEEPPFGLTVAPGQYYNVYFPGDLSSQWTGDAHKVPPGGVLAMPHPLTDGGVTFDDGTPGTIENQAKAVATYLAWAAEPHAIERKQLGVSVLMYLFLLLGVTYFAYRQVWKGKH